MIKFFVTYYGDTDSDPLDKGCCEFEDIGSASRFSDRMKNKGYKVSAYLGKKTFLPETAVEAGANGHKFV